MAERQSFIDQIRSAERQFKVIRAAISHFMSLVQTRDVLLPVKTSDRDLIAAADQVEATYLIRMWAAFEAVLRSYRLARREGDQIRAVDLINWTAGIKRGHPISADLCDEVHEVRLYRNKLVHGDFPTDGMPSSPMTIEDARRRLNRLLHCLPIRW